MQTLAVDISHKELQLALLEGEVDLSQLVIFQEKKVELKDLGIKIHAGIIGTSHFIQFTTQDGVKFTEILACNAHEPSSINALFLSPIEKVDSSINIKNKLFNYSFDYSLESYQLESKNISVWSENQKSEENLIHLEFEFNISSVDLPPSKTIISAKRENNDILIQTFHEYQEEDTIVFSESKLSF